LADFEIAMPLNTKTKNMIFVATLLADPLGGNATI
jgi:hypothetical protein